MNTFLDILLTTDYMLFILMFICFISGGGLAYLAMDYYEEKKRNK